MPDQVLLTHCSPTLAGIKTGNIFTCTYRTRSEVMADIRRWNRLLSGKGLRVIPLKYMKERVLLYVYRPSVLRKDLADPERSRILRECGYEKCGESECICTLIRHLRENSSFPHEIGLFIGYPAEDVSGFIRNQGSDYKFSGMWKVYGDVEKTRRLFRKYRHCTDVYCRLGRKGRSLADLAVRVPADAVNIKQQQKG